MKKILLGIAIAATSIASTASATTLIHWGNVSGNDNNHATVISKINGFTGRTEDIQFYDKYDGGSSLTTVNPPADGSVGTWDVINNSVLIKYITVKAGNNYATFEVVNPSNNGPWNTSTLGNKDLSHISFWAVPSAGDPQVPEPSTLAMGAAAIGLLAFRKFRS